MKKTVQRRILRNQQVILDSLAVLLTQTNAGYQADLAKQASRQSEGFLAEIFDPED